MSPFHSHRVGVRARRASTRLVMLYGAVATLMLPFVVNLSGCSIVGLGVGALVDANQATRYRAAEEYRLYRIPPGTRIIMVLDDSTRVAGQFQRVGGVPNEVYAERYRPWLASLPDSARLPALGERISIQLGGKRIRVGHFQQMTRGGMRLEVERGKSIEVPLRQVTRVEGEGGREFPLELLRGHAGTRFPVYLQVAVRAAEGSRRVDLERVARLEIEVPKHGMMVGFLVGATIDAAVVVALSTADFELWDTSGCGTSAGGFGPV